MVRIGYTMMTEQAGPRAARRDVVAAEEAGFDFSVTSDHYFPWLESQGHAPYAWSVLGAAAQATERIPLMTYVTCPTIRYHPAVVAQKAATLQISRRGPLPSRPRLRREPQRTRRRRGLARRPRAPRDARGGRRDHPRALRRRRRQPPRHPLRRRERQALGPARPRVADRDRGLRAAVLRARRPHRRPGDRHRAEAELADRVRPARRRGQAARRPAARLLRHRPRRGGRPRPRPVPLVRSAAGRSTPSCPAPPPSTGATQFVRPDDVAEAIPCGADVDAVVEAVRPYAEAGFTEVALVQIGGDHQEPFLDWAEEKLLPALRDL